jgi:Flp pilus assembly protein TadG
VVEFVLISGAVLLLFFGALQMAILFNAALSVSQYAYAGARYAAIHGIGSTASAYGSTIKSNVTPPPTINDGCLSTPAVSSADPSGKITSGAQLTVLITYSLVASKTCTSKVQLPASFFGFSLPTALSNSTSLMAE